MNRVIGCLILLSGLSPTAEANPLDAIDSLQVRTGALFLHRSDNNDGVIVRGSGGQSLWDASQTSPGGDTGWELSLIGRLRDDFALEVRYFGLDSFSYDTQITRSPAGLGFAIDNSALGLSGGDAVGTFHYESQLYNIEFNERWRVGEGVEFLLGLRHVQNKETLQGLFENSSATNEMQFAADNYLTGVQVGVDARLLQRGRFGLEGLAKLGVYHNAVRTRYDLDFDSGSTMAREWSADRKNAFSLLGELQLMGVYQFSDRLSLRGGYQLLLMTGIATAPNQVDGTRSQFVSGTTGMNATASDSPIYHGLSAQLEIWLHK